MSLEFSASDYILLLLKSVNREKINGKLYFQKEMFLAVKEICPDLDGELKFEPYHYGPYSIELANLLDNMELESLINIDNDCTYSITDKGVEKISSLQFSDEIIEKTQNLKRNSNNLGYKGLLRYVYFNYPDYTVKSKIIN